MMDNNDDSDTSADHDYDIVEAEVKKIDENTPPQSSKSKIHLRVCPRCGKPITTHSRSGTGTSAGCVCNSCGYKGMISLEVNSAEDLQKIHDELEQANKIAPPEKTDSAACLTSGEKRFVRVLFVISVIVISLLFIHALSERGLI